MKKDIQEKLFELLDHPERGLKESSNTNKNRYNILALFEYEIEKAEERGAKSKLVSIIDMLSKAVEKEKGRQGKRKKDEIL